MIAIAAGAGLPDGAVADTHGWFHPADEADVVRFVRAARAARRRVRVRGAHHSVPSAVAGPGDIVLVLDRFQHIDIDTRTWEVSAGAGLRLGVDPLNPRAASDATLCPALHAAGRALPNLGGIVHQTVAGFLATGSAGGSTRFDAAASVVGLRFVDGHGDVHRLRRENDAELLDAVLVAVGSCGIVTEVTFATEPAFDVSGTETVVPDRGGAVDLFAEGETGLAAVLERNDYVRVLWWPQRRVQRIVVWIANRTATEAGETRPYDPMPRVFGSLQPVQVVAGATLWCFVHWRRVRRLVGQRIAQSMERVARPIEAVIYRAFVDGDPMRPQCFRGAWHDILPQDQQMDERWMPTTFTEMFVPIERTADVLCTLERLFASDPDAAGRFAIELYASPPSSSWMHPSYGRASLRVNVFWLMHAPDDPRERFMARLWHALEPFAPRLHWGKLSPHEPSTMVAGRYPRFEAFLAIRDRLDPDGLFMTDWLLAAFGRAGADTRPLVPLPRSRMPATSLQWPLLFALEPATRALLGGADHIYEFERVVPAPGARVLSTMFDGQPASTAPGFVRFVWHGPVGEFADAVLDEVFVFMTIRMRTVEYEPGRLVLSVERCSLQLARQMVQVIEFTDTPDGCRFRWRIAVTFRRDTGWASPTVIPLFRRLFAATLDRVCGRAGQG